MRYHRSIALVPLVVIVGCRDVTGPSGPSPWYVGTFEFEGGYQLVIAGEHCGLKFTGLLFDSPGDRLYLLKDASLTTHDSGRYSFSYTWDETCTDCGSDPFCSERRSRNRQVRGTFNLAGSRELAFSAEPDKGVTYDSGATLSLYMPGHGGTWQFRVAKTQ